MNIAQSVEGSETGWCQGAFSCHHTEQWFFCGAIYKAEQQIPPKKKKKAQGLVTNLISNKLVPKKINYELNPKN